LPPPGDTWAPVQQAEGSESRKEPPQIRYYIDRLTKNSST
jgi:hypothetical protein